MSARSPTERVLASLLTLLVVVACAGETSSTTSAPTPEGMETSEIRVGDIGLTVWVADTGEERGQGLRGVQSLPEGIEGMLFVWDSPATPTFGMMDTVIPLDIWWFSRDGVLIGMTDMATCPDGDCVPYGAPGTVSWARETPDGAFAFEPGDLLTTS